MVKLKKISQIKSLQNYCYLNFVIFFLKYNKLDKKKEISQIYLLKEVSLDRYINKEKVKLDNKRGKYDYQTYTDIWVPQMDLSHHEYFLLLKSDGRNQ